MHEHKRKCFCESHIDEEGPASYALETMNVLNVIRINHAVSPIDDENC